MGELWSSISQGAPDEDLRYQLAGYPIWVMSRQSPQVYETKGWANGLYFCHCLSGTLLIGRPRYPLVSERQARIISLVQGTSLYNQAPLQAVLVRLSRIAPFPSDISLLTNVVREDDFFYDPEDRGYVKSMLGGPLAYHCIDLPPSEAFDLSMPLNGKSFIHVVSGSGELFPERSTSMTLHAKVSGEIAPLTKFTVRADRTGINFIMIADLR